MRQPAISVQKAEELADALNRFREAWAWVEEGDGCDGWGGAECARVWQAYRQAGSPAEAEQFIREHANTDSSGKFQGRKPV